MASTANIARAANGLPPESVIFGSTRRMSELRERIQLIAAADVPVLITGDSGTGKDVIARYLHFRSPAVNGPLVKVNCPAIPEALFESELFGYEKGAFTGAYGTKPGRIELAHRGTLFLDEISELELPIQSKLLQVLQDGHFCRIGAQDEKQIDVRVICATNRELKEQVELGTFRRDLYYRISVVIIHLPRLAERAEDIPALVQYFCKVYSERFNCKPKPISESVLKKMVAYHWPGNIRELENVVKRYVIFGNEAAILSELQPRPRTAIQFDIPVDGPISLKKLTRDAVRDFESHIITRVLEAHHWNRRRAARALNISYRALLYKLKERETLEHENGNGNGAAEHLA